MPFSLDLQLTGWYLTGKENKAVSEESKIYSVWLKDAHRQFHLPFPLESIGFIEGHPYASVAIRGKLELCIRLSSAAEFAKDKLNDTVYVNRFPNICIKLPEILHTFTVDRPRDAVYFKYAPEFADAMKASGLLAEPYCRELKMRPEISNMLREIRTLMEHSQEAGTADRLDLLALRLLQEIQLTRKSAENDVAGNAKIQKIASGFQMNFLKEIDFGEIAARNGLSLRNFFRLWGETFPLTPAAYIQQLKLNEACRLLQETNEPVWEITAKLRFRNSSYFCRIFRKRYGVTPLQYRKDARLY